MAAHLAGDTDLEAPPQQQEPAVSPANELHAALAQARQAAEGAGGLEDGMVPGDDSGDEAGGFSYYSCTSEPEEPLAQLSYEEPQGGWVGGCSGSWRAALPAPNQRESCLTGSPARSAGLRPPCFVFVGADTEPLRRFVTRSSSFTQNDFEELLRSPGMFQVKDPHFQVRLHQRLGRRPLVCACSVCRFRCTCGAVAKAGPLLSPFAPCHASSVC